METFPGTSVVFLFSLLGFCGVGLGGESGERGRSLFPCPRKVTLLDERFPVAEGRVAWAFWVGGGDASACSSVSDIFLFLRCASALGYLSVAVSVGVSF